MSIRDALSNLVNKFSGGGSGAGTPSKTSSAGGAKDTGAVKGGVNGAGAGYNQQIAEEAIGIQLSGANREIESAKSAEEKATSAIEDLMGKLGLTNAADEEIMALKSEVEKEITTKAGKENTPTEGVEDTEGAEETDDTGEVDTTGIEEEFDNMSQEELEALNEELDDYLEFSDEEAKTYVEGEAEVQARIDEAVENNPDMDPAEVEAQIREAYELENPEYAEAKKEAERVEAQHDEAMEAEYNAFCEENPQPVKEDFDDPAEYTKALNKWSAQAEEYMAQAEEKYRNENENYDNLKDAEFKNKIISKFPEIDINPEEIEPLPTGILRPDPGFTKIIEPTFKDPGFTKIVDPTFKDPGFSRIIEPEINTLDIRENKIEYFE